MMELEVIGQPMGSILEQLQAILESLQSSSRLGDTFSDPVVFFRQLHMVFSRARTDQSHRGLHLLIEVIQECCRCADRKQRYNSVSPLITDIIMCLTSPLASNAAKNLLTYIGEECDIELKNEMKEELDRVILNSKDQDLVDLVKKLPRGVLERSTTKLSPKGSADGSRSPKRGSLEGLKSSPRVGGKGAGGMGSPRGESPVRGKVSGGPSGVSGSSSSGSGVMKLSFLPHSIKEQWLLASGAEEVRFVLEEVTAVYLSLNDAGRESSKPDIPIALRQVMSNMASEPHPSVLINGLKFMESVSDNNVEAFLEDRSENILESLYPKLSKYMESSKDELRRGAQSLAVSLVAQLPFHVTHAFILQAVENESKYPEMALRIACVGLIAAGRDTQQSGREMRTGMAPIRIARVAKAAVLVLNDYEEKVTKKGGAKDSVSDRMKNCMDIAKDVTAAALLVLCSSEADEEGIFPEDLPNPFVDRLLACSAGPPRRPTPLSVRFQADITLRASGLSFPSMISDPTVSSHVQAILSSRVAGRGGRGKKPVTETSLSPTSLRAAAQKGTERGGASTPDNTASSTWPGASPSPTSRRLSPSAGYGSPMPSLSEAEGADDSQRGGLKYTPSWGSGIDRADEWPDGSSDGVDRSKLHVLKTTRRKPGSRRAHSAEIGSMREMEANSLREAPSTSDGQRPLLGGGVGTDAPLYTTIGNFTEGGGGHRTMKLGAAAAAAGGEGGKPKKNSNGALIASSHAHPASTRERRGSKAELLDTTEYMVSDYGGRSIIGEDDLEASYGGGGGKPRKSPRGSDRDGAGASASRAKLDKARSEREKAERDLLSMFNEAESGMGIEPRKYSYFAGSQGQGAEGAGEDPTCEIGNVVGSGGGGKKKGKRSLRRRPTQESTNERQDNRSISPRESRGGRHMERAETHEEGYADSRGAPSALKPESLDYLDTVEVRPSDDPRADLQKVGTALLRDDWLEVFHALNVVRQLVLHHQALLITYGKEGARSPSKHNQMPAIRNLASSVLKHVENLRSQVAKNAIITLGDMFIGLKSKMDAEVPAVVPVLIKKCGDQATTFLSESAESTLCHLIDSVSPSRSLSSLISATEHRNPALRGKVAGFLHFLIAQKAEELRGMSREIDSLKLKLKTLINDNTPEARASSRDIVRIMLERQLSTRSEMEQIIPPDAIAKAMTSAPSTLSPKKTKSFKKSASASVSPKKGRAEGAEVAPLLAAGGADIDGIDFAKLQINTSPGGLLSDDEDDQSEEGCAGGEGRYSPDRRASMGGKKKAESSFVSPIKAKSRGETGSRTPGTGGGKKAGGGVGPTSTHGLDISNVPSNMGTPSRAKATTAKRLMESNEELSELPDILQAMQSASWKDRLEAMVDLTELMLKHMVILRDASKLETCVQRILEALEDGSVKVNIQALQCLHKLHIDIPSMLPSLQLMVFPALLRAASSGNKSVCSSAQPVLKDIMNSFPLHHSVPHLCHMALYEIERLKVISLRILAELVPKVCGRNSNPASNNVIKNSVFPTIRSILLGSTPKGDARVGCSNVLKEIQRACPMGEHVWRWVEDTQDQDTIKRCIGA